MYMRKVKSCVTRFFVSFLVIGYFFLLFLFSFPAFATAEPTAAPTGDPTAEPTAVPTETPAPPTPTPTPTETTTPTPIPTAEIADEEGAYWSLYNECQPCVEAFLDHFNYEQDCKAFANQFIGNNNLFTDEMDITYFCGHGYQYHILMADGNTWVDLSACGSTNAKGLGDNDCEFLVLESCRCVPSPDDKTDWAEPWFNDNSIFDGLHMVCGFRTPAWVSTAPVIANYFGGNIASGGKILDTWLDAIQSKGTDTERGAVVYCEGCGDDTLYNFADDPPENPGILYIVYDDNGDTAYATAQATPNATEPPPKSISNLFLADKELYMYTVKETDTYLMATTESLAHKLIAYVDAPIEIDSSALFSGEDKQISMRSKDDPSAVLEINLDIGEIIVNSGYGGYFEGHGDTPGLLKKDKVKKTARIHLKNLGLFPGREEIGNVDVTEIRLGIAEEYGKSYDYGKLQCVRFNRVIDGLPVQGASRIIARLAELGRLHSLIYIWMEVEKTPLVINPDLLDNNNIMEKAEARLLEMGKTASNICVQSMDLVLYDDGEQYIEPAIYVVANLTFDNLEEDIPVDFYIPVAKNSKANFPFK